ncbi:MAG: hypothetical protein V2G50_05300 [bacterium JZ-2024 1]
MRKEFGGVRTRLISESRPFPGFMSVSLTPGHTYLDILHWDKAQP